MHERRRYCNLAEITNSVRSSPPSAFPSNCIAQRHSTKGASLFFQVQPSSTHLEDFWLIRQSSSQSESHISAMERKKWNLLLGTLFSEWGRMEGGFFLQLAKERAEETFLIMTGRRRSNQPTVTCKYLFVLNQRSQEFIFLLLLFWGCYHWKVSPPVSLWRKYVL